MSTGDSACAWMVTLRPTSATASSATTSSGRIVRHSLVLDHRRLIIVEPFEVGAERVQNVHTKPAPQTTSSCRAMSASPPRQPIDRFGFHHGGAAFGDFSELQM